MRSRLRTRRLALAAALVAAAAGVFVAGRVRARPASGPVAQGMYVWQRQWDEPVAKALARAAGSAQGFTALAAEVWWRGGRARVTRVRLDYAALKTTRRPVGLALRLGSYAGPFDARAEATVLIAGLARDLIREARAGGIEPAEVQVDFDCAASKLQGYREWVSAVRTAAASVPLTITALPSWLHERAFPDLARATDGYVLQVHSLEPPAGPGATMSLCDPEAARRWVEEAGKIGMPFRVALPTYSYLAAFGEKGQVVWVSAEGPSRGWDRGTTLRLVRSHAAAMAGLVHAWQTARPAAMQGILWYRMPVEGDRLNWTWPTLATVMTGMRPREELRVEVAYPEPELAEIVLVNAGLTDMLPATCVEVGWESGELLGADGLRGYRVRQMSPTRLRLDCPEAATVLAPGERWQIGWLRFKQRAEVRAHVTTSQR